VLSDTAFSGLRIGGEECRAHYHKVIGQHAHKFSPARSSRGGLNLRGGLKMETNASITRAATNAHETLDRAAGAAAGAAVLLGLLVGRILR